MLELQVLLVCGITGAAGPAGDFDAAGSTGPRGDIGAAGASGL